MSTPLTAALPVEFTMDAAIWITAVATIAGTLFMAFVVFLALGPHLSTSWANKLGPAAGSSTTALEPQESD